MTPQSTPKRRERILENADRKATAARFLRALARHIGEGDVDDLALLAELEAEVERARAQAVAGLRAQGYSWEDVARGLGTSRQYAWRRYGPVGSKLVPCSTTCAEWPACPCHARG